MITQRELDDLQRYITVPIELLDHGGRQSLRLRLPEEEDGWQPVLAISSGPGGLELSDQSSMR